MEKQKICEQHWVIMKWFKSINSATLVPNHLRSKLKLAMVLGRNSLPCPTPGTPWGFAESTMDAQQTKIQEHVYSLTCRRGVCVALTNNLHDGYRTPGTSVLDMGDD